MREDDCILRYDAVYSGINIRTIRRNVLPRSPTLKREALGSSKSLYLFCDTSLSHIPESSTPFFVGSMAALFSYYASLYEKCYNETNVRISCG